MSWGELLFWYLVMQAGVIGFYVAMYINNKDRED